MSFKLPPAFSPRPIPLPANANPHLAPFREIGLPTLSATMMWEFEKGFYFLALCIEKIDRDQPQWQSSAIRRAISPTEKILDILLSMSVPTIRAAITGQLHILFSNPPGDAKLPSQSRVEYIEPPSQQERPVIYALAHCSSTYQTPTKREYIGTLNDMYTYITEHDNEANWTTADRLAYAIDRVNPGVRGRNWDGGLEGKAFDAWTTKGGTVLPHPRRYCTSQSARQQIQEFINVIRTRLAHVREDNQPIPWSITYTGWTRQQYDIEYQHHRHEAGQELPYLLEACMWRLHRRNEYLLRNLPLVNIPDADLACYGEHVVSILTGSYSLSGGLNGTMGGPRSIETNARRLAKPDTWKNGLLGLEKQEVYKFNKLLLEQQLSDRQFYQTYKEEGSEMSMLKEQANLLASDKEDSEEAYKLAQSRISDLASARILQLEKEAELEKTFSTLGVVQSIYERTAALRKRLNDS